MAWPSGSENSKLKRQKFANIPVVPRNRSKFLYLLKPVYFNRRDFMRGFVAATSSFENGILESGADEDWPDILSLTIGGRVISVKVMQTTYTTSAYR